MLYLFVDSAELSVLVEQQELLLIGGGDCQALRDQCELLICGQQSVLIEGCVLCPAHTGTRTQEMRMLCAINKSHDDEHSKEDFYY